MSGFIGISGLLPRGAVMVVDGEWLRVNEAGELVPLGACGRLRARTAIWSRKLVAWVIYGGLWVMWCNGRCSPMRGRGSSCWRRAGDDGLCETHSRLADEWEQE